MKNKKNEKILIGKGSLSWNGAERRTDRYGSIGMFDENSVDNVITKGSYLDVDLIKSMEGISGSLFVIVTETRDSTHIGDLFRGIFPQTPNVRDEFTLGNGKLFQFVTGDGYKYVGVEPHDGRKNDWLDVKTLYMVHEQDVELYFIPDEPIKKSMKDEVVSGIYED